MEIGIRLLAELFDDPIKFNQNKYKGYELLNQYLRGFEINTLTPVLESVNPNIHRLGVSIASELSSQQCSVLLTQIISAIENERDPLYLCYGMDAIFKGTYNANHDKFIEIVIRLDHDDYKIQRSAMNSLAAANIYQLRKSLDLLREESHVAEFAKGVSFLIDEVTSGVEPELIKELITSQVEVDALFGCVLCKKAYDRFPELIEICLNNQNEKLRKFAEEVIELNKLQS